MIGVKKIFVFFLSVLLCFVVTACDNDSAPPPQKNYVEMQTDITVTCGKADSYVQRDDYGFTVTRLSVEIEGKSEFAAVINAELDAWLKYGLDVCDDIIRRDGIGKRTYRVVNSVTCNKGGLLSLRCSIDYSEYGETISRTFKSVVWDVGREERITPLMMLDMSATDYENFLTLNLSPKIEKYRDQYPDYLVNGAGKYSEYIDYYITLNGIYLYATDINTDYSIEDISFETSFKELPELFDYDLSAE